MWIVAIALMCSGVILPLVLNIICKETKDEKSKPIKEEYKQETKKPSIIYLVIGVLNILIGVFFIVVFFNSCKFSINSIETTATITNITRKREGIGKSDENWLVWVYVEYYIENVKYEKNLHEYNKDMYEGKNITIYYNEENPNIIKTSKTPDYTYIVMCLIFIFIGVNFIKYD